MVPERELTLKELAQHDGSDPDRPLMLAIRGTVFDITPGATRHTAAERCISRGKACFVVALNGATTQVTVLRIA